MRVGILADELTLSGWRKAVFDRLMSSDSTKIALIIHAEASDRGGFAQRVWRAVDRAERVFAKLALHSALARSRGLAAASLDSGEIDISSVGALVSPLTKNALVQTDDLDLIIDLTRTLNCDVLRSETPVWRVVTRAAPHDRASPLGFWEHYRGDAITDVAIVERRAASEAEIASASFCTFPWSWSTNDHLLGLKAAALLEGAMRDRRPTISASNSSAQNPPLGQNGRSLDHAPVAIVRGAARLARDALERAISEDRWRIVLSRGDPLTPRREAPTIIESQAHSYWADPFVVRRGSQCHIFFEEYLYATKRGVISHICVDDPKPGETLRDIPSTIIIDQPHHLSYPFIFTFKGETYMMPESSAARTLEIWQATNFPHGWTRVASPLSGVTAADSSLLEWDGRWWLFTNIDRSGMRDHRSELHVFYADDPIAGPWTAHTANPVVIDARCGRMAGGFLKAADGRPIRCGQVQGRKYGQDVAYRLITELTESTYAETALDLKPIALTPGARTHHLSARDGMIIADECFVTSKWKRRAR